MYWLIGIETVDISPYYSLRIWWLLFALLVLFLYDRVTKRIPSRLRPDQAPKSGFGLVPINGFGDDSASDSSGCKYDFLFLNCA